MVIARTRITIQHKEIRITVTFPYKGYYILRTRFSACATP